MRLRSRNRKTKASKKPAQHDRYFKKIAKNCIPVEELPSLVKHTRHIQKFIPVQRYFRCRCNHACTVITKWTKQERDTFERCYKGLADAHPRQNKFVQISQRLPNKSIADCIQFYYSYKNRLTFKREERRAKALRKSCKH
ncbi:uncharacterized protein LOC116614601 isoform X2 [Nematostella vectensis]|uniref:uncharacterized protein LOC116614601 isoform X2 n=1 Tax=Nematostella vectensis TaxID=45351 RepID=UPI0020777C00|nr:uncharacterized protein LOC116614601 isoform X2 [Nematostella vectensis]